MQPLAPGPQNYFARFLFVATASVVAALAGFLLLPAGGSATLMWPPSAVGLAMLFLYGYDLWPAVTLSIFGVFLFRNGNVPLDLAVAVGDTLEAFLGAYFLRIYVGLNPLLWRLRDSLGLLVACIAPTLAAALIITLTSYFLGRVAGADFETNLVSVWIAHAVSALSFSGFLIRWLYRPIFTKTKKELAEGILIFSGLTVCSYLTFWTSYNAIGPVSLIYILLLLLIWAGLRSGPRGTTLALALFSILGTSGIIYGHGALSANPNAQVTLGVQVLLGALDILFLLFVSIVEERKEAALSLQTSVTQLERAIEKIKSEDQAKTNFLAILAHELRNPLAPIVTSVELMQDGSTPEESAVLLDTIESHARTMSLLLDDLLDISRITQNKFELKRERIALQPIVQQSLETVQAFLTKREHSLHLTLPAQELFLDADPVRLEQILVNLLNNAGKYTDPGGKIKVVAFAEGRSAVLSVTDTGIGIAPEKLPGVFEPFGQRGAVVRTPGGLGVGLSLTKQLVELHGGTIEAYSAGLGQGSTFSVRLPLSTAYATSAPRTARSFVNRLRGKVPAGSAHTILIIDDNEAAAKGLAMLLERRGHTVHLAYNGAGGLAAIERTHPDTVILDIGLPDMNGFEVAEKIKSLPLQPQRLIALTGYGQEEDKSKSREAGFDGHLTKPVSLADIEAVL